MLTEKNDRPNRGQVTNECAITKAVFPVAGLGTRFLPATKASPKEMLPVVDKPLIQYAVEEAVAAGITDMIFITGRNKRAIEDHFDKAYELETELSSATRRSCSSGAGGTPPGINCIYVRQTEALGLGHAVLCAAPVVGDEPFAVILADDLIDARCRCCSRWSSSRCARTPAIGVKEVPAGDVGSYGIVETQGGGAAPHHAHRRKAASRGRSPRRWRSSAATCCRRAFSSTCAR